MGQEGRLAGGWQAGRQADWQVESICHEAGTHIFQVQYEN